MAGAHLGLMRTAHLVALILMASVGAAAQNQTPTPIHYQVSMVRAAEHLINVQLELAPGRAQQDIQLPVWNALYQVRDFAQYVNWLKAENAQGKLLTAHKLDKTTWRIEGAEHGARVSYQVYADQAGPYGAQANSWHAFLNLAEILLYPVSGRKLPVEIRFTDLPRSWRIAISLSATGTNPNVSEFQAEDYDHLVDSPVEMGTFTERSFDQEGAHYQVIVDADPADYDLEKIVNMVSKVVHATTGWMRDRPFDHYLFFYHFPRRPGGGGMEHAYSAAIEVNSRILAEQPHELENVTAHEFFHLWNVKRIRPQSLEPIDYTKESYTRALWFSEGVTSTVAPYLLLRAGLFNESDYLEELGREITSLAQRPAHRTQSAEESSLDAWLEKYTYYRSMERSISYYNKGELLGVMLDLELREFTEGKASLRDVFQWMNEHYAKQGRFFPDSEGVRQAVETLSHTDWEWFFGKYVSGTEEIPYDQFLKSVGLHLVERTTTVADPGFAVARSFGEPAAVAEVTPASEAEHAGLVAGDLILQINGQPPRADVESQLSLLHPGDLIHITIRRHQQQRELAWRLRSRQEMEWVVRDVEGVTPQQQARRRAWLAGEDQEPGDARP